MKYLNKNYPKTILLLLLAVGLSFACTEDLAIEDMTIKETLPTAPRAIGDWINFNSSSNKPYTRTLVENDFGPLVKIWDWKEDQAYIINNTLKVTMLKNAVSQGGLVTKFWVEKRPTYEVTFKVKFYNNFDFAEGGKLGFGFGFGDVRTGENPNAPKGDGGSVRIMWKRTSPNVYKIQPYIYHYDVNGYDTFEGSSTKFPENSTLVHNQWYTVKMRVKANTDSTKNGEAHIKVNGVPVLSKTDLRFAINDNKRWVSQLLFQTFRGGNDSTWWSGVDSHVYYDDIKVTKDPIYPF